MKEKILVKFTMNQISIECEASEEFVTTSLPKLVSTLASGFRDCLNTATYTDSKDQSKLGDSNLTQNKIAEMSMNSLAAKIGVNSGANLVLCACAHLDLIQNTPSFDRRQILDNMKNAIHYFKKSMSSNLSKYLSGLVKKGELIETSQGKYTLSASKNEEILLILDAHA